MMLYRTLVLPALMLLVLALDPNESASTVEFEGMAEAYVEPTTVVLPSECVLLVTDRSGLRGLAAWIDLIAFVLRLPLERLL